MKIKYIEEGLVKKADTVDMGALLVYPEEEWRRRYRTMIRQDLRNNAKFCSLLFIIILVPIFAFTQFLGEILSLQDILWIIVASYFPFIFVLVIIIIKFRQRSQLPPEGLYEEGVFVGLTFVPYEEVQDVTENTVKNFLVGRIERWQLKLKPADRGRLELDYIEVDALIFGFAGLARLHELVWMARERDGPPKLVVYRGKGGVAKREYVPEAEDV
ncbi:MAG: hypothetical protein LN414_01615 [Candidatus Thermoplasmatota archaeon]|nr:hypothetical protein [Candidatus Thermoplasmatota archaeon]